MVKCSQCLKMQRCFDCPLWFLGKVQVISWQIQLLSTQSQWNLPSWAWHKSWAGQSNLRSDGTSTLQRFTRYKKQHNHINPLCSPHITWWIKFKILLTLITLPFLAPFYQIDPLISMCQTKGFVFTQLIPSQNLAATSGAQTIFWYSLVFTVVIWPHIQELQGHNN